MNLVCSTCLGAMNPVRPLPPNETKPTPSSVRTSCVRGKTWNPVRRTTSLQKSLRRLGRRTDFSRLSAALHRSPASGRTAAASSSCALVVAGPSPRLQGVLTTDIVSRPRWWEQQSQVESLRGPGASPVDVKFGREKGCARLVAPCGMRILYPFETSHAESAAKVPRMAFFQSTNPANVSGWLWHSVMILCIQLLTRKVLLSCMRTAENRNTASGGYIPVLYRTQDKYGRRDWSNSQHVSTERFKVQPQRGQVDIPNVSHTCATPQVVGYTRQRIPERMTTARHASMTAHLRSSSAS